MEEKIKCIQENKDSAIAALNTYLDSIYNLTDKYFNREIVDGKTVSTLKEGLTPDEKAEKYILELENDAKEYESVRAKISSDDFNLSLAEIARVGLAYVYVGLLFEKQLVAIKEAQTKTLKIIDILQKEKEKVD